MTTKTFDLNYYNVIIGGIPPEGYADGESVKFTPDGDDWNFQNGADGQTSRNRTNIKSGMLEITLLRTSATNTFFSALRSLDLATPGGALFPVIIKDTIGQTAINSDESCFVALPEAADGNGDPTSRVWQIKMMNIDLNNTVIGGNEV